MTFNPDNLVFFYLLMALLAAGSGLLLLFASPRHGQKHKQD